MRNKKDQSLGTFLFSVSAFFVLLAGFIGIINRFLYTIPIWVFYGLGLLGIGIFGYGLYTLLFSFPEGDDAAAVEDINDNTNVTIMAENTQGTSTNVETVQTIDTTENIEEKEQA